MTASSQTCLSPVSVRENELSVAAAAHLERADDCAQSGDIRGEAAALFAARAWGAQSEVVQSRLIAALTECGCPVETVLDRADDPLKVATYLKYSERFTATGHICRSERIDHPERPVGGWGLPTDRLLSERRRTVLATRVALWALPATASILAWQGFSGVDFQGASSAVVLLLGGWLALGTALSFGLLAFGILRLGESLALRLCLQRAVLRIEDKYRRVHFDWVQDQRSFRRRSLLQMATVSYITPRDGPQKLPLYVPLHHWERLEVGDRVSVWFLRRLREEPIWSRTRFQTTWNLDRSRGPLLWPLLGLVAMATLAGSSLALLATLGLNVISRLG